MTQATTSQAAPTPADDAAAPARPVQIDRQPSQRRDLLCNRVVGGIGLAACLGVLIIARALSPASGGYGTHEQLGLQACGFKEFTDLPCMTCGMTTAFSHSTRGQFVSAFIVQPAGTGLAIAVAMLAFVFAWAALTGISLSPLGRMLGRPRVLFGLFGLMLAAWLFEIVRHLQM